MKSNVLVALGKNKKFPSFDPMLDSVRRTMECCIQKFKAVQGLPDIGGTSGGLFQSGVENCSDNKLAQTSSTTTGKTADTKL